MVTLVEKLKAEAKRMAVAQAANPLAPAILPQRSTQSTSLADSIKSKSYIDGVAVTKQEFDQYMAWKSSLTADQKAKLLASTAQIAARTKFKADKSFPDYFATSKRIVADVRANKPDPGISTMNLTAASGSAWTPNVKTPGVKVILKSGRIVMITQAEDSFVKSAGAKLTKAEFLRLMDAFKASGNYAAFSTSLTAAAQKAAALEGTSATSQFVANMAQKYGKASDEQAVELAKALTAKAEKVQAAQADLGIRTTVNDEMNGNDILALQADMQQEAAAEGSGDSSRMVGVGIGLLVLVALFMLSRRKSNDA